MIKLNFEDVLCHVICAGEDEKELMLIRGLDSENYEETCTVEEVDSERLLGVLFDNEDQFIECNATNTRLNLIMQNESFFVDIC